MITNEELTAVKLSPTKKDFYQIWNELLDLAGKISERWDPASTNESDPGIVLLKVLTAVADKLNYNIDANTLEAFMPSAAQEESMRKLTEMMGYDMKYYQSATTEVKITYNNNSEEPIKNTLYIDKFTNLKDIDDNINYVTLEALGLNSSTPSGNVTCMEGELIECETDDNNIVSMFHLDDNKRYFLPETQIAENGIFISNIENNIEGQEWRKVSNLNAQSLGSKVFKFGFDSQERLPYVQFPDDISTIIEDGLRIKYIRTSGADGNISANTLSKLSAPVSWSYLSSDDKAAYHDVANYTVTNIRAATNGISKESINAAYNNFKKTIGTFDTLVTCRDYINKIYQLISATDNTTPLVSNVIVSDIKDDINRAVTLCTFTNRGIEYKVQAKPGKDLTNFDLMLYPFKSVYGLNSKSEFEKSFNYDDSNVGEILTNLEDLKTIAHNIKSPDRTELACIKNYYRLKAKVNTVRKVGIIEQASILDNIYKKIYENFNMRQLDFGEEIPYDVLLKVMETADSRIKNISLDEPKITTKFATVNNVEYTTTDTTTAGKQYYNSLVLNNVLAGRVPLFNYNTNFATNFKEKAYSGTNPTYEPIYSTDIYKIQTAVDIPIAAVEATNILRLTENEVIQFRAPSLSTDVTYPAYVNYYLHLDKDNTQYKQSVPATMQTLENFLKGGPNATDEQAANALNHYINNTNFPSDLIEELVINDTLRNNEDDFKSRFVEITTDNKYFSALFIKIQKVTEGGDETEEYSAIMTADEAWNKVTNNKDVKFYSLIFEGSSSSSQGVFSWAKWLINLSTAYLDHTDPFEGSERLKTKPGIKGFYKINATGMNLNTGYLVDSGNKYKLVESTKDTTKPFQNYYVPRIWYNSETPATESAQATASAAQWHTVDGLGQDAVPFELSKGIEYELKPNEYLLINYIKSKAEDSDQKEEVYKTYGPGHIIKPNFTISDSNDWHNAGHSFTKFNVKFEDHPTITKMFTLGADQQIEIRKLLQVKLDEQNTNLYWIIPSLTSTQGEYLEFPWDEEPIDSSGEPVIITESMVKGRDYKYSAYTLKEGEYLYYTDMNQSDIAFYGFGTTIRRKYNTPEIYKYASEDSVKAEDIITRGLNADIPWRNYDLREYNITITENQFINLTEGDYLVNIELAPGEDSLIDNKYRIVKSASYAFATENTSNNAAEADLITSQLPPLSLEGFKWEVHSKLNLAVGPTRSQTLKTKAIAGEENINKKVKDKLTLIKTQFDNNGVGKDSEIITLAAENENKPLSFKTNKSIISAASVTNVATQKYSENGILEQLIPDLQIKLFESRDVKANNNKLINIGNYGSGQFTAINFEEQAQSSYTTDAESTSPTAVSVPLNALISADSFGLLMIYYQNLNDAIPNNTTNAASNYGAPKLTAYNKDASDATELNILSFFNSGSSSSSNLILKNGINIIKIDSSAVLKITSGTYKTTVDTQEVDVVNNKIVLTIGNLDLVYKNNALNPKLCYKVFSEGASPYNQILADISLIDENNKFYYNAPIANNLDIDMSYNDEEDTLENPLNWFNYNNVNNKFVISVIDTKHLSDDITIARSSRSNF